jgi:predicted alpha-1,2-mannosidase
MKTTISIILFGLAFCSFAQIKSIGKLQEARDKGREKMKQDLQSPQILSKTLYVNPFIGTGGHGHTYPGATMPFGMMQLSPDTRFDGWDGCGGYHYSDSIIYGFSHTHLSGTGVSDYADLLITPQSGEMKWKGQFEDPNGYGHLFSHEKEQARPGYYSVKLLDSEIDVELSVTERTGIHHYTFNKEKDKKYILLDLDYRDKVLSANFKEEGKTKLSGHRISHAWAEEHHFYFSLESNVPWDKSIVRLENGQHKMMLCFPKSTKEVYLKVGISAVDNEGAQNNLISESPDWDFNHFRAEANKKWEKELTIINYQGLTREDFIIFYTALYHSFLNPNLFSDVDGRYRGMDKKIHSLKPGESHYTVFSLWDTFRAEHPLFTLTQRERTSDFIQTLLRQSEQNQDMPVWELAGNETECMIGYHSVSVIVDAYMKGFRDFDTKKALAAMIATSKATDFSKDFWATNGYLSLDKEPESVSKALEYAYDDYCISIFAEALGKTDIAAEYKTRSFNFINHFDPKSGFFRARRGAQWMSNFAPEEVNFNYTEANAWQYSLFAPHAVNVLSQLHGGRESLERHLDDLFSAPQTTSGRDQADITGLIGQYAHGNEPSHHMAYLYNRVGKANKGAFIIDQIQKELYSNTADGLSGNEDCGQMSAWYVLSALGFYPVSPGSAIYDIGRPMMKEATLQVENNKIFYIKCLDQSKENKYISKIELNGEEISRLFLHHEEIVAGGELLFTMSDSPNPELEKYSSSPIWSELPMDYIPLPHFDQEDRVFEDILRLSASLPVEIPNNDFKIEYREENGQWTPIEGGITIDTTCVISMRTSSQKLNFNSPEVSTRFSKRNKAIRLSVKSDFANQYSAGGPNALIDGLKGSDEFRTGDWQGYYNEDVWFDIEFDTTKNNVDMEIGFLEDLKSWIFYPEQIQIFVSSDGFYYEPIIEQAPFQAQTAYRPANHSRNTWKLSHSKDFKYVRVIASNAGLCPEWHLGVGNPTWLFLDEVEFH